MPRLDWLDETHDVYDANLERWQENERRLRGGDFVFDELRRFLWETAPGSPPIAGAAQQPGEHYLARQAQAVYLNFPEWFVTSMKGHLLRNRPLPGAGLNFGELGEVRRERDYQLPTPAELIYYNADGVGNDGSQWDNFWMAAWVRACATGHRWIFVEAPVNPPQYRSDEIAGLRPYLVDFGPQAVTNWHFENGRLAFAVVRMSMRRPRVVNGAMEGASAETGYMLLVRRGVDYLGDEYARGGWWTYDGDKNEIDSGDWAKTYGEIPLFPFFYERDTGLTAESDEEVSRPAMSRPAITEIGQAAVAYMNLSSAADYDAWDAAASLRFLMGVDRTGFNLAAEIWNSGSQIVPVPTNEQGQIPQLQDGSAGSVASTVFDTLLKRKMTEAERLCVQEAVGSPDASGLAKQVGFGDIKAPRLANIASEIEQAQNVAIHFLELRWGFAQPSGSVIWPREFEIVDVVADITRFFELEKISGYRSPTMGARLMVKAAQEGGHIVDDADATKIAKEYEDAAETARKTAEGMAALSLDAGVGGGDPDATDDDGAPALPAATEE